MFGRTQIRLLEQQVLTLQAVNQQLTHQNTQMRADLVNEKIRYDLLLERLLAKERVPEAPSTVRQFMKEQRDLVEGGDMFEEEMFEEETEDIRDDNRQPVDEFARDGVGA